MDQPRTATSQEESGALQLTVVDPLTELPQPAQISRETLRAALINNPSILIGALHDTLENRFGPDPQQSAGISNTTSISVFIEPGELALLSPRAQQLTRGDLLALAGWGVPKKTPEQLGITVTDIKTLRDTFGDQISAEVLPQKVSISCCCCSPCCCSAAAVDPDRAIARA